MRKVSKAHAGRWPILKTNFVFTMQEWVADTDRSSGAAKARAVLVGLRKRFPNLADIDGLAANYVHTVVSDLENAEKYAEAFAAIDANKDLLKNKDDANNLVHNTYDPVGQKLDSQKGLAKGQSTSMPRPWQAIPRMDISPPTSFIPCRNGSERPTNPPAPTKPGRSCWACARPVSECRRH